MKKQKFILAIVLIVILLSSVVSFAGAQEKIRIAMLVKNLGNAFFEACRDGGLEASKELGGIEFIFQGPSTPTAEGQIEIIESLIAQKVDAIAISANDKDALVPVCQKAMKKGITVISWDSGIEKAGRILNLNPSDANFIGRSQVKMIAEMIGFKGEIAVLSASSQATNQNTWINF